MPKPKAPTIILTKDTLSKALMAWEEEHRAGKCLPYEEGLKLPIEEAVRRSTDALWAKLSEL